MPRLRWRSALVAALAVPALLTISAMPASAVTGSVQIGPVASTVARIGMQIPVTVSLVCDPGFDYGNVGVSVVQASGTSVVSGGANADFSSCTGETQTLTVLVVGGPWHGGAALASAYLSECSTTYGYCVQTYPLISAGYQKIKIRG